MAFEIAQRQVGYDLGRGPAGARAHGDTVGADTLMTPVGEFVAIVDLVRLGSFGGLEQCRRYQPVIGAIKHTQPAVELRGGAR